MSLRPWFVVASITFQALAFAQTPLPAPQPQFVNPWATLGAQVQVPGDPLEAVTNAEPVQDVTQRMTAIQLLDRSRTLSMIQRSPYHLKSRFTALGNSPSAGTWQLEDIVPGTGAYRWTAQGPAYSAVNLITSRVLYSNQQPSAIPLRLAQVRAALFFHYPVYGPRASIRLATGNLNGTEVTCVLVAHQFNAKPISGPRHWDEFESCVDPKSGLLMSYSPTPGLFVVYDYSSAQHFHDRIIPGKFNIYESGQTIVEGQIESLTDPGNLDASLFQPAGLSPLGIGTPMTPPLTIQTIDFGANRPANATNAAVVVLHGMLSADGHFSDTEILSSSNPNLNQQAVQRAAQWQNWRSADQDQAGVTPQAHEVFFTTLFLLP